MTLIAGVCGHPVAHSLSPLIHGAWIAAAGLDAAYEKFDVAPDRFAAFVRERGPDFVGLNITVPHKEAALALAGETSAAARAAGAANLLTFSGASVRAGNTDGVGLLAALAEQAHFTPGGAKVVILGAGGAARGAAAALLEAGAEVGVFNRTVARAEGLAASPELRALGSIQALSAAMVSVAFEECDLVINATTLGLGGGSGPEADLALTPSGCVVMDMVYKPLRTEFLRRADALGRPSVDGLAMLVGQARPSFEAFFGQTPDPAVDVRGLALKALGEA